MRAVVIGGTGHIGSHLIPMLVKDGIDTVVITRGRSAVPTTSEWSGVQIVRSAYNAGDPAWTDTLKQVLRSGDTLIDILGTDLARTYDAAKDRECEYVIGCGSVWM